MVRCWILQGTCERNFKHRSPRNAALPPTDDALMRIPPDLLRTIFYIGETSGDKERLVGTGFFVAVPDEIKPHRWMYMVTAKHVLESVDGNYWIRINLRDGTTRTVGGDALKWRHHPAYRVPDNRIDIAVCMTPYDVESTAFTLEPRDFVYDPVKWNISVGDEAFVIGLFTYFSGSRRNTPIVRTGNLAMLPEEKVPTADMGDISAYLLEVRSFGGMSGAPVFIRETVTTQGVSLDISGTPVVSVAPVSGVGKSWLLGLIHGHWDITERQINDMAHDAKDEPLNLGIAVVVPAFQLAETLMQADCVAERRRALAELLGDYPHAKA